MRKLLLLFSVLMIVLTGLFAFINQPDKINARASDDYIIDTLAGVLAVPREMVFIDSKTVLFSERN